MTPRVAAIVLAAGLSRRFGTADTATKVVAPFKGIPLVRAVAMTALASRATSVSVVTGHAHETVATALKGLEVVVTRNPAYASGMASSLKLGLSIIPAAVDGVIVMLADMPLVRKETINRLIAHFEDRLTKIHAVLPIYDSRRGNPALIGRALFTAVETLTGDEGARRLLQKPGLAVELCDVDDPGILFDIDTPQEAIALNQSD